MANEGLSRVLSVSAAGLLVTDWPVKQIRPQKLQEKFWCCDALLPLVQIHWQWSMCQVLSDVFVFLFVESSTLSIILAAGVKSKYKIWITYKLCCRHVLANLMMELCERVRLLTQWEMSAEDVNCERQNCKYRYFIYCRLLQKCHRL